MKIIYDKVAMPIGHQNYVPVDLTRETMEEHREKVLKKMEEWKLDSLVIYADREHGANFAYLTGFEPRFEEALLILHKDGTCYLMLGNENMKMGNYSFIAGKAIHVPHFSLPCQPMETTKSLSELIAEADIKDGTQIGCVGWKLFTGTKEESHSMFDIPCFMIEALKANNPNGVLLNACAIFLDPMEGLRAAVNANELAHYEFGAGLASAKVLYAMNQVAPGKTELQIAENLSAYGQPLTVTTICAAGERFTNAVVFPRNKKIEKGDKISLTFGLRGGLSSRAAYAAESGEDLEEDVRDYVQKVAIPYYTAAASWYEMIGIGVSGAEIYRRIEQVFPKEEYHWSLNPGHLTGAEEWIASPIYAGSSAVLKSGMMLQMDIIPSVQGYGGVSAEDGIAIADERLREQIRETYPEVWNRIQRRREYMSNQLGISLKEEVLPMSDICGYFRPYILNHEYALRKQMSK